MKNKKLVVWKKRTRLTLASEIELWGMCSYFLKAGFGMKEMLDSLTRFQHMRKYVQPLYFAVIHGQKFSYACKELGLISLYTFSLLELGERTGNVSIVIDILHEQTKNKQDYIHMLVKALLYPSIVICAGVLLVIGILYGVFPKIIPIFDQLQITLPPVTRFVLFIYNNMFFLVGVMLFFVFCVVGVYQYIKKRREHIAFTIDSFVFSIPVFGTLYRYHIEKIFFGGIYIVLLSGGVVVDGIRQHASHKNKYITHMYKEIEFLLQQGNSLSYCCRKFSHIFAIDSIAFIELGEHTGRLQDVCGVIVDKRAVYIKSSIEKMIHIIEPLLIASIACVVGIIALAIMLPLYSITQGVQQIH